MYVLDIYHERFFHIVVILTSRLPNLRVALKACIFGSVLYVANLLHVTIQSNH